MAKLIISSDGRDKVYEIIDERFTIGSGPDADLQLRGDGISGQHITVDKTKSGYRLIDMETKGGTLVNGKQVNQHVLGNGDTIQLGDVKITYMGKGPARAGAASKSKAPGRGQKLESSHYYRHANKAPTSSGARFAMIGSAVLGILFILYLALSNTQPPQSDINRSKLMEAIRLCAHGTVEEETIVATIREFENMKKSEEEKKLLTRLRDKWAGCLAAVAGAKSAQTANSAWIKVRNVQNGEAQNRDKLRMIVKDFIEKYEKDASGRTIKHIRQARAILADLEELGEMTADEKELARVGGLVREGLNMRDHHLSMRGLKSMDPEVRAAHQDVWEKFHKSIRMKSRQYLGVRKNEVRGWLRKDEDIVDEKKDPEKDIYDPAKAREVAIERIFNKLLHEVVVDYLDSPDKSSRAWNQKADERAQALFRELLKEIKPNY